MAAGKVYGPNPNHRTAAELPAIKKRLEMLMNRAKDANKKAQYEASIEKVEKQMGESDSEKEKGAE